jgi:hypothetical protein
MQRDRPTNQQQEAQFQFTRAKLSDNLSGQPRLRRLDWPHHNQTDEEWLWLLSDYNMKLYNRSVMQSWR